MDRNSIKNKKLRNSRIFGRERKSLRSSSVFKDNCRGWTKQNSFVDSQITDCTDQTHNDSKIRTMWSSIIGAAHEEDTANLQFN